MKLNWLRNVVALLLLAALLVAYFGFHADVEIVGLSAVGGLILILLVKHVVTGIEEGRYKRKKKKTPARKSKASGGSGRSSGSGASRRTNTKKKKKRKKGAGKTRRTTPAAKSATPVATTAEPEVVDPPVTVVEAAASAEDPDAELVQRVEQLERELAQAVEARAGLELRLNQQHEQATTAVQAEQTRVREQQQLAQRTQLELDSSRALLEEERGRVQTLRSSILDVATDVDLAVRGLGIPCGKQPTFIDLNAGKLLDLTRARFDTLAQALRDLREKREEQRKAQERKANEHAQQLDMLCADHERALQAEQDEGNRLRGRLQHLETEVLPPLRSELDSLRQEVERKPKVLEHPIMSQQMRIREAFGSVETALALLDEPDLNLPRCYAAFLTMDDGAALITGLYQQVEASVDAIPNKDDATAHEEAWGPWLRIAEFVAAAIDQHVLRFLDTLEGNGARWPIEKLSARAAALPLATHMLDQERCAGLYETCAFLRLLSRLHSGMRVGLAHSTTDPEQMALRLFGGSACRKAVLKLNELSRLDPGTVRREYDVRERFTGKRNDPQGLRYKRWLLTHVTVTDPQTGEDIFAAARKEMNGAYAMNEGLWRTLVIALMGSNAQPRNHGVEKIDGIHLLGFDPRDLLFFLDPSEENCRACGLDNSHLGHFAAMADLVDPERKHKGDLDCYLEFFQHLVAVRGIGAVRGQADHRKSQAEKLKGTASKAERSAA